MKKALFLLFSFCLFSLVSYAQMSDEAVVKYVKEGVQQGKSQQQLTRELVVKGVTKEQVERIRDQYQASQAAQTEKKSATDDVQRANPETQDLQTTEMAGEKEVEESGIKVFGRDIFRNQSLTFEPSMNMATPQNYRLGPGDQLVIEVWGASENNFTQKVSPEGYISIPQVGPINVNGLTVQAASEAIRSRLSKIYSGMGTTNVDVSTNAKVTLGQIRTIQINIMGEVAVPGTYAVSSFSTVFHALYKAGGVSQLGSLRNIKVVRGGRTITTIDVYDYIINGRSHSDIRLQEGDVILVSPYEALVQIEGNIKRPMYYEMKSGESLRTLIDYAGGFTSDAYASTITIERNTGREKSVCTVDEMNYVNFKLKDGDQVSIGAILQRYTNRVQLKGAVYRPGFYEIGGGVQTVGELIAKADGILEEAFTNRAILHRENDDKTLEVISVDLKGILAGTVADIPLQKNDVLFIPSIHDLKDQGTVSIYGEVYSPGEFPYAANTKLEDLIIQAGGLKESASTLHVDVARRIINPDTSKKQKEIAETYTFSIKDGFVLEGEAGFVLQPYDQVFVRRSPGYSPLINVGLWGEVEYEGNYTLSIRNERLSDLVKKAGGLSDFAYIKGARLERQMSEEEYLIAKDLLAVVQQQNKYNNDSIGIDGASIKRIYSVGIDLEKALAEPHSDYDIALREGDRIIVPQYNNTITIRGNVRMPNTVTYDPSQGLKYYIKEAGGYGERAKKGGVFILYPNGHIKELGRRARASKIEPGSQIIVPSKHRSEWNLAATLQTTTTSVSMLAVIASLINTLK